jgi:WD40 repeat protein
MNAHLSEDQLIGYVYRTLADAQRETMDLHLGTRSECRARLLKRHRDWVSSAAYSPDGRTIVTASADLSVRIWIADIQDLMDAAESLVQRQPPILTPEERERFPGE